MAYKSGKNCKVTLGTSTGNMTGMGSWSIDGISSEQLECYAFTEDWKTFAQGVKDGGTVSFSGVLDPADTTQTQSALYLNVQGTTTDQLKLWLDSTSYFMPCKTAGYWSPTTTTGASTVASSVNVTAWNIAADKAGYVTISFTAKVNGCMVLV
jgi:hypothetical protein